MLSKRAMAACAAAALALPGATDPARPVTLILP